MENEETMLRELEREVIRLETENKLLKSILEQLLKIQLIPQLKHPHEF